MKAIAIYRDNCKVAQPLSGKGDKGQGDARAAAGRQAAAQPPPRRPHRDRPQVPRRRVRGLHPRRHLRRRQPGRHLRRHRQGGHDPRRPDELVHDLGLARACSTACRSRCTSRSSPTCASSRAALTNDPDIRAAKSIVDYVFRWMGKKFLTVDQQEEIGILSPEVRARMAAAYANGAPEVPESRAPDAGPDGALQHARGRDRVLALRRPDGPRGHVLHVPRLRDEHRLRLGSWRV